MSFLIDILQGLGAGESIIVAAILVLAGWYVLKTVKLGKFIGALLGSAAAYAVAGLFVLAVATGLGWVDPRPGLFFDAIATGIDFIISHGDALVEFFRGVVG